MRILRNNNRQTHLHLECSWYLGRPIFFSLVCLCGTLWMCVCVCACTWLGEGLGLSRMLPPLLSTFICCDKVSLRTWAVQIELGWWPVSLRDPPVFASHKVPFLKFYLGSADLSSYPQACTHVLLWLSYLSASPSLLFLECVCVLGGERARTEKSCFVIVSTVKMRELLFAGIFCLMAPDRLVKMVLLWLLNGGKIPQWKATYGRKGLR